MIISLIMYPRRNGLRTPNEAFFLWKSWTFGLGQTNWPNEFCGIWGIFGRTISTHFGTYSESLDHVFYYSTIISTKIQSLYIPIPNIYLGYEYKSLVFWLIIGKHGQGTHHAKMGADSSAENTSNATKFIGPICLPKPKSFGYHWKNASLGVRSPWPSLCSTTIVCCAMHSGRKIRFWSGWNFW